MTFYLHFPTFSLIFTYIQTFYSGVNFWKCTILNARDEQGNILTRQMLEILSDHENASRVEASNNCTSLFFVYFFGVVCCSHS